MRYFFETAMTEETSDATMLPSAHSRLIKPCTMEVRTSLGFATTRTAAERELVYSDWE